MELEAGVVLPDLSGFTMILPSVSVGNVGQLAVDVVLATLKPKLVTQVFRIFDIKLVVTKKFEICPDSSPFVDPLLWS